MKAKQILPIILIGLMGITLSSKAQNERLKTAIIFQFTRLIEWCPTGQQGNFTIGVMCDNKNLIDELRSLEGRRVVNQIIEVKQITHPNELASVNIVFVSRARVKELPTILSMVGSNCTLIVTDQPGAANQGAGISFIEVDGSLQFEINREYAQRHSLTVSNNLYKLAKNIY